MEEELYRDPDIVQEINLALGELHYEKPIIGAELLALATDIYLRMRSVWTKQEAAALLVQRFSWVEHGIEHDAFTFQDEHGPVPFLSAEKINDNPELGEMARSIYSNDETPDTIPDWMNDVSTEQPNDAGETPGGDTGGPEQGSQ